MPKRFYYSASISSFMESMDERVIHELTLNNDFDLARSQKDAWIEEINILRDSLFGLSGQLYFEYSIPRMGRRIDVVVILQNGLYVLEFKVGEKSYPSYAIDQACDYALDLKNFHEESHACNILPVLISTEAPSREVVICTTPINDKLYNPVCANKITIKELFAQGMKYFDGPDINIQEWENSRYCPTPTIIEAATALYRGHSVAEISRSDAGAINLSKTSNAISEVIENSKQNKKKSICFVTGVPGAGKTLIGLNIATKFIDKESELYSVFLSGNGPLVSILREALARDRVRREKERGNRVRKNKILSEVKAFIQNIHHFRDDCLIDNSKAPVEHVALFDEAQRAWNLQQTSSFMKRKKNRPGFNQSEPEFLISCLDRHLDWSVIVCLVGGGQEINTGEAGIGEWIESLNRSFSNWHIHISPRLMDSEFGAGKVLETLKERPNVSYQEELHLSVSMRSFRAEHMSEFVKHLLDLDLNKAKDVFAKIKNNYPLVITRDLNKAKTWLRQNARGSERYGIIVSSEAERLKPHAIFVRSHVDPIHWFLNEKDDVRSSYYLEDVATEFYVQGLELDWACVTWDGDFRYSSSGWRNFSFKGNKWEKIKKEERKIYQKNAYRVLLTRARQGMVIVIPKGDASDHTRLPEFYDPTFHWLLDVGIPLI